MKRLVIMTVGKTHSGKSTFANALEKQLDNSMVIDQDNHAGFINTHYKALLPKQGPNTLKIAITKTIVDYAMDQTDFHLILSNSNLGRKIRMEKLEHYHNQGFTSILVNFELPDHILQSRVANSERSTTIFRSASTFEEVLMRQQASADQGSDDRSAIDGEADHLFIINSTDEVPSVINKIVDIAGNL